MSFQVVAQVLECSESKGVARLVAIVFAETAHHDGVGWLDEPMIAFRARASTRQVRRAKKDLEQLGEVEFRKVQRGRRRIDVFRIRVGAIPEVDYTRLPFNVDPPFVTTGQNGLSPIEDRTNRAATTGQIVHSQSKEEPPIEPPITRRSAPRKKDLVWDTLSELYGEPAPHETSLRGKIGRDLRAAMPDATDEEVAKEIRRRAQAYRAAWPSVAFTDTALRARWTTLGQMLEAGQGRAGRTAGEKARDWIDNVGWQIADESDVRQMLRDFGLDDLRIARALTYRDEVATEKRRERETVAAASGDQQLSG